jgi:hypothetical protein
MENTDMKRLISAILILVATACFLPRSTDAFELPSHDPWYYQNDGSRYFWIPDKAQHYWGSLLLGGLADRLPMTHNKWTVPVLAVGAGLMWEFYQDQQGLGFSERDLFADVLGVVSSQINGDDFVLWLRYSTEEDVILWNLTWRF